MDVPENITDEQLAEIKEVFSFFDKDGDGVVGVDDLGPILRSLGFNPSQDQISDLVDQYNDSSSGEIGYLEIMTIASKMKLEPPDTEESLREAFQCFDKEGLGTLTLEKLQNIMMSLGEKLSEDEMKEMLDDANDGEGNVNIDEFSRFILRK